MDGQGEGPLLGFDNKMYATAPWLRITKKREGEKNINKPGEGVLYYILLCHPNRTRSTECFVVLGWVIKEGKKVEQRHVCLKQEAKRLGNSCPKEDPP